MTKSIAETLHVTPISEPITSRVEQASSSAHQAINRASDAAGPAVDHMATSAHHAVDQFAGVASQAAHTLEAKGEQWRKAQSRLTDSCSAHVRDKPLASLGIALATGFLLSWLLRLR